MGLHTDIGVPGIAYKYRGIRASIHITDHQGLRTGMLASCLHTGMGVPGHAYMYRKTWVTYEYRII